jgi:hypothetical protein
MFCKAFFEYHVSAIFIKQPFVASRVVTAKLSSFILSNYAIKLATKSASQWTPSSWHSSQLRNGKGGMKGFANDQYSKIKIYLYSMEVANGKKNQIKKSIFVLRRTLSYTNIA